MIMTKRQRKEKLHDNGTKEYPRIRMRTSGETNSPPCQPNLHRAGSRGGDKTYIKRKPGETEASPLELAHPHASKERWCTLLAC